MPLPIPRNKEKKSEFVSRCISDLTDSGEFKTQDQRIAVCYKQFDQAKAGADVIAGYGMNEFIYNFISSEGEYECEDCEYEGGKASKCPKCGSPNYEEDKQDKEGDLDEAEEATSSNIFFPKSWEYATKEEVEFDESDIIDFNLSEYLAAASEYQGRNVKLNKPFRTSGGPKKFAVYVKNPSGKIVIVRFGDPNMKIKKNIPARRKSFRARHNCDNPGPKHKARYWACKSW